MTGGDSESDPKGTLERIEAAKKNLIPLVFGTPLGCRRLQAGLRGLVCDAKSARQVISISIVISPTTHARSAPSESGRPRGKEGVLFLTLFRREPTLMCDMVCGLLVRVLPSARLADGQVP